MTCLLRWRSSCPFALNNQGQRLKIFPVNLQLKTFSVQTPVRGTPPPPNLRIEWTLAKWMLWVHHETMKHTHTFLRTFRLHLCPFRDSFFFKNTCRLILRVFVRLRISMPDMTGRPGCRTMEMNGGSSVPYLARTTFRPLVLYFVQ